jgi:hypothetical protein
MCIQSIQYHTERCQLEFTRRKHNDTLAVNGPRVPKTIVSSGYSVHVHTINFHSIVGRHEGKTSFPSVFSNHVPHASEATRKS